MSRHLTRLAVVGAAALCTAATNSTAQPALMIDGFCPGELRVLADGLHPRALVDLYYSPQEGYYVFPPFHPCYGVEVGLNVHRLRFVGKALADDFGIAMWEGTAGAAACGGFLQAINNYCQITHVAQIH